MKKNYFRSKIGILAVSALAWASCQDYEYGFTEDQIKLDVFNQKYDEAFAARFGTPNPENDWGMTELQPLQSLGGASTRAGASGTVHVNRNEWILREDQASGNYHDKPYRSNALAHDIQIPGWPHLNGLYYGSGGGGALEDALTADELDNKGNSWQPVGDVTEYEIQYVSAWFRTHKITNPEEYREQLHLTDFFIQNISQDDDQKSYEDIDYSKISITDVSTRYNGENISTARDASTYTNEYITRKPNSSEVINYKLDELGFKSMDGVWTHVNNFNNQNANQNPEESLNNPQREIKYITSSGTEDFNCHPSFGTDQSTYYIDSWVLVHLTWVETVKDPSSPLFGKAIPREGYYLAFDFQASKQETQVAPDGYYSNWIVKITPGHFNPEADNVRRVMVEDLGGSFDFDFNDVVFDIAYDGSTREAIINLQAAGGTMPVIVGKTPSDDSPYEVHNLFGVAVENPINVGAKGQKNHEVAIYRISVDNTDLSSLEIHVKNTENGTGTWKTYSGQAQKWMNLDNSTDNPYGDKHQYTDPNASEAVIAPRAFAVPLKASIEVHYEDGQIRNPRNLETKWMQEEKCIHETYYEFDNWVQSASKSDEGYGMEGKRGWWEQTVKAEALFTKNISEESDNPTGDGPNAPATWIALHPQTDNMCFSDYYLDIVNYNGEDAIWKQIVKESVRQVTFTVVFESELDQEIEAILIPADVTVANGVTTMSYQGTPFVSFSESDNKTKVTSVFTRWQQAVESENRYVEGKKTYVCRFTFTKEQLRSTTDAKTGDLAKSDLSSYFFLYVKTEKEPVTIPAHPSVADKSQWYIHY